MEEACNSPLQSKTDRLLFHLIPKIRDTHVYRLREALSFLWLTFPPRIPLVHFSG